MAASLCACPDGFGYILLIQHVNNLSKKMGMRKLVIENMHNESVILSVTNCVFFCDDHNFPE